MGLLISIVYRILNIYYWLIFIYIIFSWIPMIRQSNLYRIVGGLVEPYLRVFRRIIPPIGGLDFSPILAIIALRMATSGFLTLAYGLL